ncbi:MAG TPA: hypothetical protein VJ672_04690 [Gemmatimonadaceae bacterium]|nr:hypothetical protein [Gemmatimonadaceae bacterium]
MLLHHEHAGRAARRLTSLLVLGFAACADGAAIGEPPVLPPVPGPSVLAELQVDVDARTGEIRFTPVSSTGPASDVRAQIYGDQNFNVRLSNTPAVVANPSSTLRTVTADIQVKNLRPHPIGDEQGGVAPTDTMGIFVFFTTEPVVTQTSGACTGTCFVRIGNHMGSATFDQPNRKYFYWPERLRATGSLLGDTTLNRRTWRFEMSPEVTNFRFFVLVSAAWPSPFETTSRWKVDYRPDSIPDVGTEPGWRVNQTGAGGTWSITGTAPNTQLNLRGNPFSQAFFYRRDSVFTTTDAWMEVSMSLSVGTTNPQVGFGFTDGVKVVGVAMGNGRVGFVDYNTGTFIGTPITVTNVVHVYQLRKYAADSAVLLVDGVRRSVIAYAALGADAFAGTLSPQAVWGTGFTFTGTNSNWQYVRYEIGSPTP